MPPTSEEESGVPFIDRVSEAVVEFQVAYQALTHNGARVDDVVSYLSENGFGDEVSHGRVVRAAERLTGEGKAIVKEGVYKLTPAGERETRQLANLLQHTTPERVPSEEETARGFTPRS